MRALNFHGWFGLAAAFLLSPPLGAEEIVPAAFPASRYDPLWKKSPFTLSSVTEESVTGLAQNYSLTGVVKVGSNVLISVFNKQTQQRFLLSDQDKEPVGGVSLVSVQTDQDLTKVAATIKRGEESGVIRYDPTQLVPTNANPAPNLPTPNMNPAQNQTSSPSSPPPRPRIIRRPFVVPSAPNPPPK